MKSPKSRPWLHSLFRTACPAWFCLCLTVLLAGSASVPAAVSKPASASAKGGQVPTNLALGRPVKVSSEQTSDGHFGKNGSDGDLSTRWCANGSRPEEWWQVDLGAVKEVRGLRIHWEKEGDAAYRYLIETSQDGVKWSALVDESENRKPNSVATHVVDGSGTRHLRVTFMGANPGLWGSFWEFEAYEGEVPPVKVALKKSTVEPGIQVPEGFKMTLFGEPPAVNYPVCIAAAPTGELFVGVDENGSLGHGRMGKALRCVDTDGDGVADQFTVFAEMIHPRGLFYDNGSLWVLHPPFLTLYRDTNGDGVSDVSKVLLSGISTESLVKKRGADHTTNGIRVGMDGWIYIAVGDFGFTRAVDASGREVQFHGGGIARVRPDGTELEIFARGLRNVCDMAVDPWLNLFTRDNTNDGGGWDIRVSHIVGSAHYGYPSLYKNFADEHVKPLADYGGGSGTGALFIDEPSMPEGFRRTLLTCDWGTSAFYAHPLTPKGSTFEVGQKVFMKVNRATDMDVDGSGRLYLASWSKGGFSYSDPHVGYVVQLTATDHKPEPFPNLNQASNRELLEHLSHASHVRRLHTQWEMVRRGPDETLVQGLIDLAKGEGLLASKVAAVFALKQLLGERATPALVELCGRDDIREFALRALADRKSENKGVPVTPFVEALSDPSPRVQVQALIGLGRLGRTEVAGSIVPLTASPDAVVAHVAVKALVALRAVDAALAAVEPSDLAGARGALQALRELHEKSAVTGLISKLESVSDAGLRREILTALIRLYYQEGEWTGDWWGTRPDTSGPYYSRVPWSETPLIEATLHQALAGADEPTTRFIHEQILRHKVKTGTRLAAAPVKEDAGPAVDVAMVLKNQSAGAGKGVGSMTFEQALAETLKHKGDAAVGKQLFEAQGCVACHAASAEDAPRGPMLQDITKRYSPQELIDSILRPSRVIAQGFSAHTFETSDDEEVTGFVVAEGAEEVEIRNILGESITLAKKQIASRKVVEQSMMPDGLVAALKPEELASLLAYLGTLQAK